MNFSLIDRELMKRIALLLRIHFSHVKAGLGEEHSCHLRDTRVFRWPLLGRKIRMNCRSMDFLFSLQGLKIPGKNPVLVVQKLVVAEESPPLHPIFNPIYGPDHSHHSSRPPGSKEDVGHLSCIDGLSMPCSNLGAHKVRNRTLISS